MRIGVDLGGTKIEVAAIADDGAMVVRERRATPRDDYPAICAAIAALVDEVEARLAVRASVGIGIPGTIVPATGRIKNANTVCLIGQPFLRDMEALLGRPVRATNDA